VDAASAPNEFSELRALAYRSIDEAVAFLRDDKGSLLPFVITERADVMRLRRFPRDTFEQGLADARVMLRDDGPFDRATLVWDGYYTKNGSTSDAILVEAYEAGAPYGLFFAQPYGLVGAHAVLAESVGNVKLLSETVAALF
jgi:hypothetical protein